jgi:16S rRNA (cytosine1402-N4)-methyltransferase
MPMEESLAHQPVLYNEIIHFLQPQRSGRYIDGTVGAGGHARGILDASEPDGILLGLDLDTTALELARKNLESYQDRVFLVHSSFGNLRKQLNAMGWQMVDGILLDLGLSSMQIDTPGRGFSFRQEASLDMRFNQQNPLSAKDLVNNLPEGELADLLYKYGEERRSRQVAKAIVKSRPIESTLELAKIIASATSSGRPGRHPATRSFQALRIAVNDELAVLEKVLPQAISSLKQNGRLAVIAYHSLEDRIVKHYFRQESQDCICPPEQIVCICGHKAAVKVITKRPIRPQEEEIIRNSRARSARLRVVEKLTIE